MTKWKTPVNSVYTWDNGSLRVFLGNGPVNNKEGWVVNCPELGVQDREVLTHKLSKNFESAGFSSELDYVKHQTKAILNDVVNEISRGILDAFDS